MVSSCLKVLLVLQSHTFIKDGAKPSDTGTDLVETKTPLKPTDGGKPEELDRNV